MISLHINDIVTHQACQESLHNASISQRHSTKTSSFSCLPHPPSLTMASNPSGASHDTSISRQPLRSLKTSTTVGLPIPSTATPTPSALKSDEPCDYTSSEDDEEEEALLDDVSVSDAGEASLSNMSIFEFAGRWQPHIGFVPSTGVMPHPSNAAKWTCRAGLLEPCSLHSMRDVTEALLMTGYDLELPPMFDCLVAGM